MPFNPGVSAPLTEEQLWALVCADPTVAHRQLATRHRFGTGASTA